MKVTRGIGVVWGMRGINRPGRSDVQTDPEMGVGRLNLKPPRGVKEGCHFVSLRLLRLRARVACLCPPVCPVYLASYYESVLRTVLYIAKE